MQMGPKLPNLNELPDDDGSGCSLMLVKDGKPICRAQCLNSPYDVSGHWNIFEIKPATNYLLSGLNAVCLQPTYENSQQKSEWHRFCSFLQENNRVATVNFRKFVFYIVPPNQGSDLSYVDVKYCIKAPSCDKNQKNAPSASRAHKVMPALSSVIHEGTTDFEEEIGDSTDASIRKRKSLHGVSVTRAGWTSDSKLLPTSCELYCGLVGSGHPSGKQDSCPQKNFIRTDPSYLRTLGQAHSGWIFGAIAELIDNSRDAKASRLDICISNLYSKKDGGLIPVLCVIDDGHGMSHMDIARMLAFGHKQPDVDDPDHIGRFGIGFKTGAMRLGQDAIILTQTSHSRSVALLSQTFNEDKDNLEIPIVSYCRYTNFMEVDTTVNSEATANAHLKAIKDFSPFNEYFIGEKLSLFGEGTGTQIYIWNLDRWGSNYSLEWTEQGCPNQTGGDILIRSRRVRSRPGQISQQVPLDYSLQSYLEVIFIDPRMKIFIQGSPVKSRPLAKSLNRTTTVIGNIMGTDVTLTLGRSQIEWERMNCGMFLYWHGRLIEAYKRVGCMVYNADMGRGIIGVLDVTHLMSDDNGHVWVHSNKQGFQDCEHYAELEKWLGKRADEYWDSNLDTLHVKKSSTRCQPDHEWVQCDKCRKWRKLAAGYDVESLPENWFCYMPPFNGECRKPEEQVGHGVITVAAKRSGCDSRMEQKVKQHGDVELGGDSSASTRTEDDGETPHLKRLQRGPKKCDISASTRIEDGAETPHLKRLRRGPRKCKKTILTSS